jgi:hypothetical protein
MRNRPKVLAIYALIMLGIAISLPVQLYVLYAHELNELDLVLAKMSATNWMLLGILPALAWSAWSASPHFNWLAPLAVVVTGANNYFVAHYGMDYSPLTVHTGSFLFSVLALAPYASKAFRDILASPGKRWWRSATRHTFMQPVTLFVNGRLVTETLSYDISTGGIFVQSPDYAYYGLNSGDRVSVRWITPEAEAMEVNADVVRTAEAHGRYPRGIGLKFHEEAPQEAFM